MWQISDLGYTRSQKTSLIHSPPLKMAENAEYTKTQITRNPVYLKSLNRNKRAEKFKKFIGNKTEGNYLVNNAFIVVVVFWPFLCWEFT